MPITAVDGLRYLIKVAWASCKNHPISVRLNYEAAVAQSTEHSAPDREVRDRNSPSEIPPC